MAFQGIIPQLRTTDLEQSIRFYTDVLGLALAFRHGDFYAGLQAGGQTLHLKRVDAADKSVADVASGEHFHLYLLTDDVHGDAARLQLLGKAFHKPLHDTEWGTTEFAIQDDQGHTIYIGQTLA